MEARTENRNVPQIIKRSKIKILTLLSILTVLTGCMDNIHYLIFKSVDTAGWSRCDTLIYTIPPIERHSQIGISVLLNTEAYPYQNIAFDITIAQDTLLYHEQQEYTLSQCTPKSGIGGRCDYTLPITNITLCDTLPTTLTLIHQLEQPTLKGIREVGISVGALIPKPGDVIWQIEW